jgi:hypothetical protein
MENRTVDNLFYGFKNLINGQQSANVAPYAAGSQTLAQVPLEDPRDPSHAYQALLAEYDNGKLDGFANDPYGNVLTQKATTTPGNNFALGAVPTSEVGLYWQLASYYGMADNFFSSKLVPSFPGHQSQPTSDRRAATTRRSAICSMRAASRGNTTPAQSARTTVRSLPTTRSNTSAAVRIGRATSRRRNINSSPTSRTVRCPRSRGSRRPPSLPTTRVRSTVRVPAGSPTSSSQSRRARITRIRSCS